MSGSAYIREIFNFKGLNASIFVPFFSNWSKISRRSHFFVSELRYMQSKGPTMRTTLRMVRVYEYDEFRRQQSAGKTRNNPCLILKIMVL